MAGGAPFDFVNPEWLLTTNTGAIFDDTDFNTPVPLQQPLQHTPFTPFGRTQTPTRTAYGPLRQPQFNPVFARSPSPPHRLDPTARPFTPKQSHSRLRVKTNAGQEHETPTTPHTPRTPCIQLSPAEDVAVSEATVQAVRQLSRTPRQSSPGCRPAGVHRSISSRKTAVPRPAQSTLMSRGASAPGLYAANVDSVDTLPSVRQSRSPTQASQPALAPAISGSKREMLPPSTPVVTARFLPAQRSYTPNLTGSRAAERSPQTSTSAQQPTNPFLAPVQPMNPATWLAQTHNVGYEGHLHSPQPLRDATEATLPVAPRSVPTRSRASSVQGRRPLACGYQGTCNHRAQGKTFKTHGDLRKHQRTHLPESQRPYGCSVPGCARRFLWPKDVTRHVEVVHEKSKVRCEHCDAELCRADDLARHIATVHNGHAASPRNWAAPSPSASSVASYAMTPHSESSFAVPGTPLSSFGSASRPKVPHVASCHSIPEGEYPDSVPMSKSLTQ